MTTKAGLIFILIFEVVFHGQLVLAQSRKLDDLSVAKQTEDAKVVANFLEKFGSRPIKAGLVFWRVVRYMDETDQKYLYRYLDSKTNAEAPVIFEKISANKIVVKVGENSATIEAVSIADRKFRINGKLVHFSKGDSAAEMQAQINLVLAKKSASLRGILFDLLIQPAFAQFDFGALLSPLLQIVMMQWAQEQQASADCGTIQQASGFCSSVTNSSDPQRVSGWGLDNAVQMSTPLVQKSWSQATHDKCGGQIQALADCVNLANFAKMYGGWKPCSDPHQQGGGYVAVAYTIPCPAGGQLGASAAGAVAGGQAGGAAPAAVAGTQIAFRRTAEAVVSPVRAARQNRVGLQ